MEIAILMAGFGQWMSSVAWKMKDIDLVTCFIVIILRSGLSCKRGIYFNEIGSFFLKKYLL